MHYPFVVISASAHAILCAKYKIISNFYFRIDQELQALTCYILRKLFESAPLSGVLDTDIMTSITNSPIHRQRNCFDRKLRDCGVIFYLRDLLENYDAFIANH